MTIPDMREIALATAARGFRVFPLSPASKAGAIEDWPEKAATDPATVHRFWTCPVSGDSQPNNVGVLTGDGMFVVDVDNKNGKHGSATLDMFELAHGDLPPTFTVKTPSGGYHLYFRAPASIYVPSDHGGRAIGQGVDIKGARSLVAAPGSVFDGRSYEIELDAPIADAPAWLLARVVRDRPAERAAAAPAVDLDAEPDLARAITYLRDRAPSAIQFEGGDTTTYQVACRVMDFGVSEGATVDLMLEHWNGRCDPPWEPAELQAKIEHAARYRQNPAGASSAQIEFDHVDLPEQPEQPEQPPVSPSPEGFPAWLEPEPLDDFDPHGIEPREWLVPKLFARTFVTAIISPGGTGKTQWAAAAGLAIPAGRSDILGFDIKQKTRTWYWNQEDDKDELRRRIAAVREHFGISTADTLIDGQPGFFYNSGVEHPLIVAKRNAEGRIATTKAVPLIIERIKQLGIGLFILDPLVEFHEAQENDNAEMAAVWRIARRISVETRCAVLVSAHTRKPPDAETDSFIGSMDALRGASAQGPVVRLAYTLFNMSAKHAKAYNVPESERHRYARLDRAKGNIFLDDGEPTWFRRESVFLGQGDRQESVGVLHPVKLSKVETDMDALGTIATTLAYEGFERGQFYPLTEIIAAMPAAAQQSIGSAANRARVIAKSAASRGLDLDDTETAETETDVGKLQIRKKMGRGGIIFSLAEEGISSIHQTLDAIA